MGLLSEGKIADQELKENPFTAPPHPSEKLDTVIQAHGDPHIRPTFDDKSLTSPSAPVLYLPPLLSSLPQNIAIPSIDSPRPPLATDSRLPDIDTASLSLHKALHHFQPYTSDYATTPYAQAFNWAELQLPEEDEKEWYIVAFRSKRRAGSDGGPLYEADKKAHEEAVQNGGLIMYWYGIPNPETGMNLATCVWQSREHALAANKQPHHAEAMKLAAASFEVYELERHTLRKVRGEKGLTVVPFQAPAGLALHQLSAPSIFTFISQSFWTFIALLTFPFSTRPSCPF